MRTITVKGIGTVTAKPDYIILSMNIDTQEKEYSKSLDEAHIKIHQIEEAASLCGFEAGSVKTVSFNVSTKYENVKDRFDNYKRVFAGYCCSYRLKLAFDFDSHRLAQVLSCISRSGAEPQISILFTVKDPARVNEELLTSAAVNAREKASILCKASGVELGELQSIDYNWGELNIFSRTTYEMDNLAMPMMALRECSAPEIEPDDIDVSDTASFVWAIS
ncbi:MAG: hypothetical protein EUB_02254 [Eubacterium sp.]|uniref:SIMPL domain-containing protein n=1 Tax=Eubacterium sp. TaxID=142586 RepID=UPI003037562F